MCLDHADCGGMFSFPSSSSSDELTSASPNPSSSLVSVWSKLSDSCLARLTSACSIACRV